MRAIRYGAWALVILLGAGLAVAWFMSNSDRNWTDVAQVKIGGEFNLVDEDGNTITEQDLLGKPHAIFFGFTHCPEICPTTLYEASGWLKQLGDDGDKLGVYFVSVDPERDTPEVMSDYLSAFDPRIKAITGPLEDVEKTLKDYRVYHKKVPLDDGDYTMDHTATVYLMRADGTFAKTIAWGENPDTAIAKIRDLIDNG